MTATPATPPATLTPARKRLIRLVFARHDTTEALRHLRAMPSFAGVAAAHLLNWAHALGYDQLPPPSEWKRPAECRPPATPAVTQATAAPAPADPGTTGEWYSMLAIASGLGITVERVHSWQAFGWLPDVYLISAENIRAFVRAHPLEVARPLMDRDRTPEQVEECWLWLVSVLAGSREGAA